MATVQAAGIPSPSVRNMTPNIELPAASPAAELPRAKPGITVRASSAKKAAPTNASHLICWRSSPCRLRNRAASAAPARNAASRQENPPIRLRTLITPPAPRIPSGLMTRTDVSWAKAPVMRPGDSANNTVVTAGAASASHSTGRQRPEGTRPSGNSRNSRIGRHSAGTIAHRSIHAAAVPDGSEPGAVTSV